MIRLPKHDDITSRNSKSSGFDVESLLGYPSLLTTSQTTTGSKLTAKVQPFEVKENDLMEPSNPRPENVFPKGHQNPPFYPSLGYPSFGSPLALANLHLYSLWQAQAHAGLVNWPLIHHANPVFTQATPRTQIQSNSSDSNLNHTSRSQNTVKHPSTEG